jgi:hypothetical protein
MQITIDLPEADEKDNLGGWCFDPAFLEKIYQTIPREYTRHGSGSLALIDETLKVLTSLKTPT